MVRTPCCDKSGLRKGTWTPEEDRKLKAYVTEYGCWNWRQLPKFAGLFNKNDELEVPPISGLARCGKSCRLRWMNYLRPNIKRGNYTKEEEETIIRLHESLGNRWSTIAAELPGRTDNEVKNHWHTTLKKRLKQKPSSETKEGKDMSQDSVVLKRGTRNEKNETNLNIELLINPTSAPLILESSLSSSPQLASSDHENSSITTDASLVSSKDVSVSDNNNNKEANNLFEAYEADSGNFWTEPFFSDSFYMSSDMVMDPADQFPLLDGEILCPFDLYDYLIEGFNF